MPSTGVLAPSVLADLAAITGSALRGGNAVRLLADGMDSFGAMLDLVATSADSIRLENFIFRADSVGRAFAEALRKRAEAGVHVQVLHDPVGALMAGRRPADVLFRGSSAQVGLYNLPVPGVHRRELGRDHRKLVAADGREMVAGGICLADPWAGNCIRHCTWRDSAVQVRGPAVADAAAAFDEAWRHSSRLLRTPAQPPGRPEATATARAGEVRVRIVTDIGARRTTRRVLERVIGAAERDVLITNPYPVPPPTLVGALQAAAARGVEVALLIPSRNNHRLVGLSVEHALGSLLERGVSVYEWRGPMIHAKSVVVDSAWTLVGSSNLDPISLARNAELNVEIHGAAMGKTAAGLFREDCAMSTRLTYRRWRGRSRLRRALARSAWALRRWQ